MGPATESDNLDPATSAEVLALAVRAAAQDGVRPLSEQTVLDLRRLGSAGDSATGEDAEASTTHLVVPAETTGPVLHVAAYAHVTYGQPASAELVVDPAARRQGRGSALLAQLLGQWPSVRVWAHGDLEPARRLAAGAGLRPVRDLWSMSRPLRGEWADLPTAALPEGFAVRPFRVGSDEHSWLEVNRSAFADHPEQAHVTLADLRERMAEPWFDPSGFLVVEDHRTGPPRMAAFHWTKVETGQAVSTVGEVYVVGVHPDYQGQGLGTATTVLGLQHLRGCGLGTATLYVDGDNTAAIATYHRLGFERSAVDVMYAAAPPAVAL